MKSIKKFDGNLKVEVAQENGENKSMMTIHVKNVKSLSTNQLAGTIAAEVFRMFESRRRVGIRDFKASNLVTFRITDGEGTYITESSRISREYQERLNLRSQRSFGLAIYEGLKWMGHKPQLTQLSDLVVNEKTQKYLKDTDTVVWQMNVEKLLDESTAAATPAEEQK